MGVSPGDNSVRIWQNLPISDPKPDLHNINRYTKFGENSLIFTQVIIRTRTYGCFRQITPSKFDKICPLVIPNRSPQYQCTYQVWWKSIDVYSNYHLEMKYGQTDVRLMDGRTDITIIPRYYRVAGYKKWSLCQFCLPKQDRQKWLNYLQTVKILIRSHWIWCLILVCNVCQ